MAVTELRRQHPRWGGADPIRVEPMRKPIEGLRVPPERTIDRILTRARSADAASSQGSAPRHGSGGGTIVRSSAGGNMDTITIVVVVVIVVLAAVAVAGFVLVKRRRSTQLQQRFGSEYERTVDEAGDRSTAEKDLKQREKRRSQFEVTPLSSASADRYRDEWKNIQQRFVDEPGHAVEQADRLVVRMMRECGYPVEEFDKRADDISVDHPDVSQNYREAHSVAVTQSQGQADTEQLRQAVTSYRRLVDALLENRGVTDQGRSPGTTGTQEQR